MGRFWFHTHLPRSYNVILAAVLAITYASNAHGGVLLSTLPQTVFIEARIQSQNTTAGVAKAGEDSLIISWGLNTDLPPAVDDRYFEVKIKLCYAPESQKDRAWRKTHDDLQKDKTCPIAICSDPWYSVAGNGGSIWKLPTDIPGGNYFVRIYATDRDGKEIGYGQTTDRSKTTNLITIDPYSGRTATLDVAATVLSAFSLGSLIAFLAWETLSRAKTPNTWSPKDVP